MITSPKICKAYKMFSKKDIDAQKIIDIEDWGRRENKPQHKKRKSIGKIIKIFAESPTR